MAWMDHDMFDCAKCNDNMRRANGCTDKPTNRDGTTYTWDFPPEHPEISLDTCPLNVLGTSPDIVELFRSLNLSGSAVAIADQQELPVPYLEALSLANYHQGARSVWKMDQERQKTKAKRHAR